MRRAAEVYKRLSRRRSTPLPCLENECASPAAAQAPLWTFGR
jgi:hypothetical protein